MHATYVVIGGGIAGVTCSETLANSEPNESVILLTESSLVKAVINLKMITKTLSRFDVVEQDSGTLSSTHPNLHVIEDSLIEIDSKNHKIVTKTNRNITYKYLCICTGGQAKIIPQGMNSGHVLGLRDTDSVEVLIERVQNSKRIALIGNGGIATELIYKLENVEIDWIVKDKHITATFVDPGAAQFFQSSLTTNPERVGFQTRMRFKEEGLTRSGAALGPDWYTNLNITGSNLDSNSNSNRKNLNIHYNCEVLSLNTSESEGVKLELTNGEIIQTDLIISATGVLPQTNFKTDSKLNLNPIDQGIEVNEQMETSFPDVFAAGDVCTPNWTYAQHWFPMRLWSQARQMGHYASKCMIAKRKGEKILQDFCFELFSHSTKLFGYEVVLLGLFNGQKLGTDYECLIRTTPKMEFIKFVLKNHRLQGVILIGNTDLAETCENLILNQLDLEPYGDDILNPDIDIEDYFD